MDEIGAVVKVVDSHPCRWDSIPRKSCSFLIVSLSKSLSLCFMCSDQHVKYWMPRGFPLTNSLLLDYHVKQYIHTYTHTYIHTYIRTHARTQPRTHAHIHTYTHTYIKKIFVIIILVVLYF